MNDLVIGSVGAAAYTVPTDAPEADGTLSWDATTLVLARVCAGGEEGIGWTYGAAASAALISGQLASVVRGRPAMDVGDDAVLTCDSGTIATWAARHWTIRGNRQFYLSGNLATMAPGLPYAIGIQHAFPGRQVIAYVGDGGFAMLMAEFLTAVRNGRPVKVIINNNGSLGQILWEQMVLGYPEYGVRFPQPVADFAAWATACGGYGAKVDNPKKVESAIAEALAFDGPAIVDIDVDPNEPPLPGKVAYDQAKKFAQAFLKGQPHKAAIATTLFKDKIEQLGR